MKIKLSYLAIALTVGTLSYNCKKEKAEDPVVEVDPATCDPVSFSSDIQPILNNNCAFSGCHSQASSADGINLSSHAGATAVASSKISGSINHQAGFSPMPQNSPKLSNADIKKIECWIADGRPNN